MRRACRSSILQQDTVETFTERICQRPADALVGIDPREQECRNPFLLQKCLELCPGTPTALVFNPRTTIIKKNNYS
ncbi:hypothetical protein N7485_004713 [Penicillium canescens]|nr:hypothetical protein N7485_004713 [Penicillium canescens]